MLTLRDIEKARERIGPFVHRTPLIHSESLSSVTGADVFIKAENLQRTGAFKVRGAFNKMIRLDTNAVITASMGNHGQAVAFAARNTGMRARIVMPSAVSMVKEEATRSYGAEVVLRGNSLAEALSYARQQKGWTFIHPFDDDLVAAGQGTIGLEIMEDLSNVDAILVPVGGGGLIAGIAAAAKGLSPRTAIVGVVSESAPAAEQSFRKGKIVALPPRPTIADGIAVGRMGTRPFRTIKGLVDDFLAVGEDAVALAVLLFMERMKLVVEGAGAVPLAALLSLKARFRGQRVVLVASGGNMDFAVTDRIVRKGLATGGRIATFEAVVDDVPGSLHALTGIVAGRRANILDVTHNRFSADLPLGKTPVTVTVEVRSAQDLDDLFSALRAAGFAITKRDTGTTGEKRR